LVLDSLSWFADGEVLEDLKVRSPSEEGGKPGLAKGLNIFRDLVGKNARFNEPARSRSKDPASSLRILLFEAYHRKYL